MSPVNQPFRMFKIISIVATTFCLNNSRNYEHRIERSLTSYTVNMIDPMQNIIKDVSDSRTNRFKDGENDEDRIWIWGLDVIPKVKLFLWRCLVNALPTSEGLRRCSIDVDPICRRCGEAIETGEHALRDCNWVAFLWEVSPLKLKTVDAQNSSNLSHWIDEFRKNNHRESHTIFAIVLWTIWYSRNQLLFNEKEFSHVDCLRIASRAVWTKPVSSQPPQSMPIASVCCRQGQVLLWCGAALNEQEGLDFGVIMKDADGCLLGNRFGFIPGVFTAIEAEAKAVFEGLRLCEDRLIQDTILVMDCQLLYWKLKKNIQDNSYLGQTLNDIRLKVAALHHYVYGWTPREGNNIADRLAKFALCNRSQPQFDEDCPV
ncbi:uncharacterized protein LOC131007086 [Salvia miltiorrhiza]|uniref:uncharacterized protein LOC131007086 n=1 Tax=Salvia miltiorrhiza TaxID=226208 RepID=UPI0025AC7B30|nr:uncharacterized protein LOC131007086 [Salvia miltiorrhiza]